jgi:hypothetical protein
MSTDIIAEVASNLKQVSLTNKVLERTRSELRDLEFRNPFGTFQKGDNGRKRICALLEYVAREEEGVKIPMAQLAMIAFMKESDFKKFHERVGNFRNSKRTKAPSRQQKSSIPSLAMKLGSFLADTNSVALRAQRLLEDLGRFYRKNTHQIRDMVQHAKTYEAACFFIVATQDLCGDYIEDKPLQASTVVDVSTDFSLGEFANVEAHVRKLLSEMHEEQDAEKVKYDLHRNTTGNKKRKTVSAPESRSGSSTSANKPRERTTDQSHQATIGAILSQGGGSADSALESMIGNPFDSSTTSIRKDEPSYSPKFVAWKDMILSRAIQSAAQELQVSDDVAAIHVPRDQALEHAVRKILQSHGLSKLS